MLNVIYKILAKTIARRLQPYLCELIHVSQTGFMQERSIFYNIILFWEIVAFAELHKEDWQCYFLILRKLMTKWIGILWRVLCSGWVFQTDGSEEFQHYIVMHTTLFYLQRMLVGVSLFQDL